MRQSDAAGPWAVYSITMPKTSAVLRAVCRQSEWDAMERDQPGRQLLVRGWIESEAEAERLARAGPVP